MERLNIYFMHSNKFDYENLIYKKVLSSSVCLMQNVILPYSDNNKTKYDENNTYIKLIEDFINKELDRRSKINGDIYTLGEIN